jgi:hypothetical protein
LLEEHPDWYLREFAEKFNVCLQAIHKMFEKFGVTRKKTFTCSEKSEKEREAFLNEIAKIPGEKRIFVCPAKRQYQNHRGGNRDG